ncbi:small integral membrane protein 12-like [Pollicipes pollicipes]|uniref:small integral membrane protein 12-like n=1 Tax=Pollicipes pollicipes TaxID=41117 RepID=UPI001884BF70|nr:small integral membrane protein 12-like [Pollicipes pollicipes]XP_037072769.1 small integral membrane protein 12-like [Pollicipes pollicipes]XP_037072770.1 small integral membrane protein 12-like [Pollicipes pollicipes]
MLPALMVVLRTYAPVITLPVAALVGFVGYNLESLFDRSTPAPLEGVKDSREERRLEDAAAAVGSLKDRTFVPKSVFEKNVSPTLTKPS